MFSYGSSRREISDQEILSWAESTIKKLEGYSYLSYSDERDLAIAKLLLRLKERAGELEEQLKKTRDELSSTRSKKDQEITELKAKVEELEKKIEGYKVKFSDLDEFRLDLKGPNEALDILWSLIRNQGWELFDVVLEGSSLRMVKIKTEEGDFYAFRTGEGVIVFTQAGYEKELKEKIGYITPLGQFKREKVKLSKALKDALTKALAQYFELVKIEMKIDLFMTNILPFARLAGIEVGDPNEVRPFKVWYNSKDRKVPIYTPEEVYRMRMTILDLGEHRIYVNEGFLSLSAITQTLLEFMNYTTQQIATRYPEVVSEALNIAARSVGKLPTASLVDLGGGKMLEETEEVEETD